MSVDAEATWTTGSPAETQALGRRLGRLLGPGDVVALAGPLGAGKTQFVKGVAEGLGVADGRDVTSPTFVLINEYAGRLPVYHFDAYRLDGPEALEDLGAAEYFDGRGVSVVEWADRVPGVLPAERLDVQFGHVGPEARRIDMRALGRRYRQIVADLQLGSLS